MNIRGWWERMRSVRRKRLLARRTRSGLALPRDPRLLPRPAKATAQKLLPDDPIEARVDLVRFGAFAEAAAESMQSGPADAARTRYDEACLFFARAIDAAQRAGLGQEAAKLKARRAGLKKVFEAMRRSEIRHQKTEARKPGPPPSQI